MAKNRRRKKSARATKSVARAQSRSRAARAAAARLGWARRRLRERHARLEPQLGRTWQTGRGERSRTVRSYGRLESGPDYPVLGEAYGHDLAAWVSDLLRGLPEGGEGGYLWSVRLMVRTVQTDKFGKPTYGPWGWIGTHLYPVDDQVEETVVGWCQEEEEEYEITYQVGAAELQVRDPESQNLEGVPVV